MSPTDILAIRTALGMTQARLAQEIGVDAMTVSRWERGVSAPRSAAILRELDRLAKRAGKRTK